jgi:hypothetical protein
MMAVVVSKDSLNWSSLNAKISQNKTGDYASRVRAALGASTQFIQAGVSQKGNIRFSGDGNGGRIAAYIVEVNK